MKKILGAGPVSLFFKQRLPPIQDVLRVYAVIVLLVYSWTLFVSFYKLPSWMLFLTLSQITFIYAYAFSVNFAESLFFLLGLLLLDMTLFLPLKNPAEFKSRGVLAVCVILISLASRLVFIKNMTGFNQFVIGELLWWFLTFAIGLSAAVFIPKITQARKTLDNFAENSLVFVYIYLPLSFVSIIIVSLLNI